MPLDSAVQEIRTVGGSEVGGERGWRGESRTVACDG